MGSETKKRLLLSRWAGRRSRTIAAEKMERLLLDVDRLNDLVGKLTEQDEKIEGLEADLKEAREQIGSLEDELEARDNDVLSVLEEVKYWLHDGLVHHRLVSDPRAMLRKVEDVLS